MKTTLFSRPLKALLLVALLSCMTVKGWCADPLLDYIVFNPGNGLAGTASTYSVNVYSKNASSIVSMAFDLYLPTGWTVGNPTLNQKLVATYDPDFEEYGDNNFSVNKTTSVSDKVNFQKIHYLINSTNNIPLNGSGKLASFKIKAPDNTSAGLYKVLIDNVLLIFSDKSTINPTYCSSSFIRIGDNGNYLCSLEGVVPSEVTDTMMRSENSTFDVTDVKAIAQFNPTSNITIKYTKEIPSGTWGTICPPHDLLSDANIQYYSAVSTGSGYVKVPVGVVKGGTPAIYHTYNNTEVTLENKWNNSGFNLGEQGTGLVGVNTVVTVSANNGWFIDSKTGDFEVNAEAKEVTAFDAYFNTEVSTLPIALQVTDAGYATFHSTVSDYVLPDGAEAFIVKNVGSGDSQKSVYLMSCGKNIAKGSAVIVKAAEGFYNLTVPGSALTAPSGNKLEGGITIPNAKAYYSLESANTFKRFYTGSSQSAPDDDAVPSYNKAYLPE